MQLVKNYPRWRGRLHGFAKKGCANWRYIKGMICVRDKAAPERRGIQAGPPVRRWVSEQTEGQNTTLKKKDNRINMPHVCFPIPKVQITVNCGLPVVP